MKLIEVVNCILTRCHTLLLNSNRVHIGRKSKVFWRAKCQSRNGAEIIIGENCYIGTSKHGYHGGMPFYTTLLADRDGSMIKVGDNCRLNGVYIHAWKSVKIGDNCVFASGVNILDANGHVVQSVDRTQGTDNAEEITIGSNVWIGLNATILKGSQIGDNCVVAAGSVVRGCYPENSIIAGNPAKVVKQLDIENISKKIKRQG